MATIAASESPEEVFNRSIPQFQQRYALIAPSIGRVLVVEGKYLGGLPVSVAIDREYQIVRKLPEELRAEFFFIVAIKTSLDAHYAEEFSELIVRDCPKAFERRATEFLKIYAEASEEPEVRKAKLFAEAVRAFQQQR